MGQGGLQPGCRRPPSSSFLLPPSLFFPFRLCLQFFFIIVSTAGGKVLTVIVFGDSSVDAGNNNQIPTILKSNFPSYGRDFFGSQPSYRAFLQWQDSACFISEAFGLKPSVSAYLDPMYNISDFATGVCFASAGTGYDNATSQVLVSPPLKLLSPGLPPQSLINYLPFNLQVILSHSFCTQQPSRKKNPGSALAYKYVFEINQHIQ